MIPILDTDPQWCGPLPSPARETIGLRHGHELGTLWREIYGYGLDCLTEVEGGYVARPPTVDAIARCLVEAAEKACGSGLSTVALEGLMSPPLHRPQL